MPPPCARPRRGLPELHLARFRWRRTCRGDRCRFLTWCERRRIASRERHRFRLRDNENTLARRTDGLQARQAGVDLGNRTAEWAPELDD